MGNSLIAAGLVVAISAIAAVGAGQKAEPKGQRAKTAVPAKAEAAANPRETDEKAIRQIVDAVTKAFNAKEAKALAALFTEDAEIVSEEGAVTQGRGAIEQVFESVFDEKPKGKIEIHVDSIRFVGAATAIEDGTTVVTDQPGEPAERNRYTVVYVKQDGKWLMASARDLPDEEASAHEELKQLEWLIGEWIDESPDAVVKTSYHWTDNKRFILGEFQVQLGRRAAMSGTQRIGWDPLAKQIRSWVFDSEGGFGDGLWTRDGDQWIVKFNGVRRDGKVASATNVYMRVSEDRAAFESRDRVLGGEAMPDSGAVPIVRTPPKPAK
jgi:uncharacterized protein (TIGR02246 family)